MTQDQVGKPARSSKAPKPPKVKSEEPLYLQVARVLKEEIVIGIYPIGSQLPTEDELCGRFSVSRYTIREALRRLRDEGLVSSRQGAGTMVVPPTPSDSYVHHITSINDLVAIASNARFAIESVKIMTIDDKLALRTGLASGEEWLEVRGYRETEDAGFPPYWVEYYINRKFAAVGRLLQRHTGPIFPLIEDLFGQAIVEVHQEITATLIPPDLATVLKVEAGTAALEFRRTYTTADNEIAQVTINTHPASHFRHSMTIRRVKS